MTGVSRFTKMMARMDVFIHKVFGLESWEFPGDNKETHEYYVDWGGPIVVLDKYGRAIRSGTTGSLSVVHEYEDGELIKRVKLWKCIPDGGRVLLGKEAERFLKRKTGPVKIYIKQKK